MPPVHYAIIEDADELPELYPGAHVVAIIDGRPDLKAVELRLAGLSFRDTILILTADGPLYALLFRAELAEAAITENVLRYGTGAIYLRKSSDLERYPANVLLVHATDCGPSCSPECPAHQLDLLSGELKSGVKVPANRERFGDDGWHMREGTTCYADEGGFSRFFKQFATIEDAKAWLRRLVAGPE
jgi:hypothetical protein